MIGFHQANLWPKGNYVWPGVDLDRVIARLAAGTGAGVVLTTEKDLVRLLPVAPLGAPVAWVPLEVGIEPAAAFRAWIVERLAKARAERRLRR